MNWQLIKNNKYKEQVNQFLNNITNQERSTAEVLWRTLKIIVQTQAENCKLSISHSGKKSWRFNQTWRFIKERQEGKGHKIRHPDKLTTYHEVTRHINQAVRGDKDKYISDTCKEVEQYANKNETKDLCKKVKNLSNTISTKEVTHLRINQVYREMATVLVVLQKTYGIIGRPSHKHVNDYRKRIHHTSQRNGNSNSTNQEQQIT